MSASQLLGGWSLNLAALVGVLVAGGAYLGAARRVGTGRRPSRRWARRRTACFLAGLAVLVLASQSGIDRWADRLLSIHMVAHLLILVAAGPLLVAGAPVTLALRALPGGGRDGLLALLRSRGVRLVSHPVVSVTLYAAVLLGSHLPAVYDLGLRSPAAHMAEHAVYLWAALLFWAPVVAADPLPHRLSPVGSIGYLLAGMIPMSVIGAALASSATVAYAPYLEAARRLGVSALADQRTGASIMWLGGTLILVGATLAAAWSAMLREERRARAREEQADRGLPASLGAAP